MQNCSNKYCPFRDASPLTKARTTNKKMSSCDKCKDPFYCSEQCKLQDWYCGHQINCTARSSAHLLPQTEIDKIEGETPFIKEGIILKNITKKAKIEMNDFEIMDKKALGKGSYGEVELVKHKKNKKLFAIKKIDKDSLSNKKAHLNIQREVEVHKGLLHDNIVRLYDSFEDQRYIYLVLEYASGGTLFHLIRQKKRLNETEAFYYFIQVCSGIYFLHKNGMIHRDIKPENLLIGDGSILKICDFGWCVENKEDQSRNTFCGTLEYMAPEMIHNGLHNYTLDIWCLGILLYELLHGYAPFRGQNQTEICREIMSGRIVFADNISNDARDLIKSLLKRDVDERIPLIKVFTHPWVKKFEKKHNIKKPAKPTSETANKNDDKITREITKNLEALEILEEKIKVKKNRSQSPMVKSDEKIENYYKSQRKVDIKDSKKLNKSASLSSRSFISHNRSDDSMNNDKYKNSSFKKEKLSKIDMIKIENKQNEEKRTLSTRSATSNKIVQLLDEDFNDNSNKILNEIENFIKYQPKKVKTDSSEVDDVYALCDEMNKIIDDFDQKDKELKKSKTTAAPQRKNKRSKTTKITRLSTVDEPTNEKLTKQNTPQNIKCSKKLSASSSQSFLTNSNKSKNTKSTNESMSTHYVYSAETCDGDFENDINITGASPDAKMLMDFDRIKEFIINSVEKFDNEDGVPSKISAKKIAAKKWIEKNERLKKKQIDLLTEMQKSQSEDANKLNKEFNKLSLKKEKLIKSQDHHIPVTDKEKEAYFKSLKPDTNLDVSFLPRTHLYNYHDYENSLLAMKKVLNDDALPKRGLNIFQNNGMIRRSHVEHSEIQDMIDQKDKKNKKTIKAPPQQEPKTIWEKLFPFCTEKRKMES